MTQCAVLIFTILLVASSGVWAQNTAEPATTTTDAAVRSEHSKTASNATETGGGTAATKAQDILQLQRYFFAAARTGEQTVLAEFLAAGYPVNDRNEQSYTALMIAAYAGQAKAVELLLQAGADACLRDKRGHTALMGAMIKAEWDIARNLYAIDCDQENPAKATDVVTDKSKMTAAQFAEAFGQSEKFKAMMAAKNTLIK